jgi:hypothetical protein
MIEVRVANTSITTYRRMRRTNYLTFLLVVLFCSTSSYSQNEAPQSPLSETDKLSVINRAILLLREHYVFPDKVDKIANSILKKCNNKGYESLKKPQDFLAALNGDLEKESQDKHVNISFGPDRVKQILKEKENAGKEPVVTPAWLQRMRFENFRLRKVEWLEGNIGYFRFLNFTDLAPSKESIVSAMNFIRHSNALVLDLRDNGGGNSETLEFVLGYFLRDGLKLGEFRFRNRIEENIIKKDPVVNKIPEDVPLYILVSKRTASAAEGMASILRSFRGAVIVGENTKGEGNPGELFVINDLLYIMIPTAVSVSAAPDSKAVEGVGVTPDITINPEKSLDKALLEICKTLAKRDNLKHIQQVYEWQIPYLEFKINPHAAPVELLKNVTGTFSDGRHIISEHGELTYIGKDNQRARLDYYGDGVFGMEGKQFVRMRIPLTESPISYFEFFWDDGVVERIQRVN